MVIQSRNDKQLDQECCLLHVILVPAFAVSRKSKVVFSWAFHKRFSVPTSESFWLKSWFMSVFYYTAGRVIPTIFVIVSFYIVQPHSALSVVFFVLRFSWAGQTLFVPSRNAMVTWRRASLCPTCLPKSWPSLNTSWSWADWTRALNRVPSAACSRLWRDAAFPVRQSTSTR